MQQPRMTHGVGTDEPGACRPPPPAAHAAPLTHKEIAMLYRAFAYQFQPDLAPFDATVQPEVLVFFEAHTREAAGATLQRGLALAWGCRLDDVEFYNLADEHEVCADWGDEAPGDAALWVTGRSHGPLFQSLERTLMLVRPLTLRRLLQARSATVPLRALQRAAAREATMRAAELRRERSTFLHTLQARLRRGQTGAGA